MKKIILLFLLVVAMTTSTFSATRTIPLNTHKNTTSDINMDEEHSPIKLPIVVFYDSATNLIEVWCDNDNIQAEVYVYDESGAVEAYSPYMNVALQLTSSNSHSILIKGDDWEAIGKF